MTEKEQNFVYEKLQTKKFLNVWNSWSIIS